MTTPYRLIFVSPEVLSAPILIACRPCRGLSKPLMREYCGYSIPIAPVSNSGNCDHASSSGPLRSSSPHPKTDSGFGDISCILPPPTDATDVNAVLSSLSRGLLERPGRSCSAGTPGDCCSASRAMCIRRSHLDGAGESRDSDHRRPICGPNPGRLPISTSDHRQAGRLLAAPRHGPFSEQAF